ncbi:MAG: hypothetical protein ACXWC7_19905 [Chitinophagaceae bacterium]
MNLLKYISLLLCLATMIAANSQDSLKKLSASQVMEIVKLYHPVAKQADLLIEKAKADVTVAKGLFDPVLQHETAQKLLMAQPITITTARRFLFPPGLVQK